MKNSAGFTLIELLVLVTVVAILGTIAVPNFSSMIKNDRQSAQLNTLLASLSIARSEAIKRGGTVTTTVCAGTTTACGGGNVWSQGWVVYYTPAAPSTSGPILLQISPPLGGGNTLTTKSGPSPFTPFTTGITYQSSGLTTLPAATGPVTFNLCDPRGASHAHAVNLSITGAAAAVTTVGKDASGASLTCP